MVWYCVIVRGVLCCGMLWLYILELNQEGIYSILNPCIDYFFELSFKVLQTCIDWVYPHYVVITSHVHENIPIVINSHMIPPSDT